MNIIEKFNIFFKILNPDTKIDEQFKSNVENLVMKFPKEHSDTSEFISEFEVFIDFFYQSRKKNLMITTFLKSATLRLRVCYNDQLRKIIDFQMVSKLTVRLTISVCNNAFNLMD